MGTAVVFSWCRSMAQTRTTVQRTKLSDLVDLKHEDRQPVRLNCGFMCKSGPLLCHCSSCFPSWQRRITPHGLIMPGRKHISSRGLKAVYPQRQSILLTLTNTRTAHGFKTLVACILHVLCVLWEKHVCRVDHFKPHKVVPVAGFRRIH